MVQSKYTVEAEQTDLRLDLLVTQLIGNVSRSQIQKLIEEQGVQVNGCPAKANYKVRLGDLISYQLPETKYQKIEPENIPLDIIYEDKDLLVVNKAQGMVVHPAAGISRGTLVNALLYHCDQLSDVNGELRQGIVHRIDKDTSGLLIVAKSNLAHQELALQLKKYTVKRVYLALVHGVMMEPGGVVEAPIGRHSRDRQRMAVVTSNSKHAVTHYRVLERLNDFTLLECQLETGRTHQIRVHMAYLNHPLAGDPKYGPKKAAKLGFKGQALHAMALAFTHPRTKELLEFSAPPPDNFLQALKKLGSTYNFAEKVSGNGENSESPNS